eukprot:g10366.t1
MDLTSNLDIPQDDQLLVRALLSLATAHMMSLEPEDSHKCIDEGMPLAQTVSDSSAEGHFFLLKAQLAEFDGAKGYPQAKEFANEALKLFQMQHDESGEAAEMEEYWEEEVYEEIVGGGPVAGGQGQVQPYSGPTKEEVVSVVSDVALGLIGVESLDNDEPLMDAGLDSLAAVEFGNTLAREFSGIALPSTMMFDFPSVKLLSEFIESSMRENHEKAQASLQNAPSGAGAGQVVKRTRMVKKFRPKPRAARQAPPRQMQFNQVAEPIQIVQPMMQGGTMGGAPAASQQLASGPGPYKGPSVNEIEEVVKDTALSLIGVETLANDEPLMDAGLDSLAAVEFANAISKDFVGLQMPGTLMFDYPSVKTLTQFIDAGLREAHEQSQ